MDNLQIDITSEGAETLKKAFSLFSPNVALVRGYRTDGKKLVLYWEDAAEVTMLPFPMTLDQAASLAAGWLEYAEYGDEPDHDGDNRKGWRLYCEPWGRVDGHPYAFAAVVPTWAMYGK